MRHHLTRAAALLALTAVLLTGSASALFGKKTEPAPAEGAPQVWDLETAPTGISPARASSWPRTRRGTT